MRHACSGGCDQLHPRCDCHGRQRRIRQVFERRFVVGSSEESRVLRGKLGTLREIFECENMELRWTATENMLADPLTKVMDTSHLLKILRLGIWSITYDAKFMKTKTRKPKATEEAVEKAPVDGPIPGEPVNNQVIKQLNDWKKTPGFRDLRFDGSSRSGSGEVLQDPRAPIRHLEIPL